MIHFTPIHRNNRIERGSELDLSKPITISFHARGKMVDRGALENEIKAAIYQGDCEPARKGRLMFRKNFPFDNKWRDKHYAVKQVVPFVVEDKDKLVVITVFVYYF